MEEAGFKVDVDKLNDMSRSSPGRLNLFRKGFISLRVKNLISLTETAEQGTVP